MKVKRYCELCRKAFEIWPSKVAQGRGRFCSRKCKDEAQRRSVKRTCKFCGREFEAWPSAIARGLGIYCSRQCFHQFRSGPNNNLWHGGRVKRICEVCAKEFEVKRYLAEAGSGRFCSSQCWGHWITDRYKGTNNPNWQGGTSFEPYPPEFNEAFKLCIRERDGYTCGICSNWGNIVHHIDYNKANTVPGNCITLCERRHGKTQHRRRYWQGYLAQILFNRGDKCHIAIPIISQGLQRTGTRRLSASA